MSGITYRGVARGDLSDRDLKRAFRSAGVLPHERDALSAVLDEIGARTRGANEAYRAGWLQFLRSEAT